MNLLPLALMWALSSGKGAEPHRGQGPRWPTPRHPPPAKTKAKGKAPARPAAPAAPPPPAAAPPQAPPVDAASNATPLDKLPSTPTTAPTPPSSSRYAATSVLQVQTVLNKLGQRLKPDGLYGPKTVSAWRSTARARRLSDAIMRLGPKTVDVDARTLAALKQTAKVAGASYDDQLYIP